MLGRHPDAVLRKVDIAGWKTPAAKQANEEFKVKTIPAFRVFGTDGSLVGSVEGTDLGALEAAITKAGK